MYMQSVHSFHRPQGTHSLAVSSYSNCAYLLLPIMWCVGVALFTASAVLPLSRLLVRSPVTKSILQSLLWWRSAIDPMKPCDHIVLQDYMLKSRVIVVGDVHGCLTELELLLKKCAYSSDTDILVFVGDLVNKGPDSAGVVTYVRKLVSCGAAYCVRGNHDDAMLQASREGPQSRKKKYDYVSSLSSEDIEWMRALPYTVSVPRYRAIVVHAGLLPGLSLTDQSKTHMTCMRNVLKRPDGGWDGTESIHAGGQPWAEVWPGPETTYFGHDARRGLQRQKYAVGLDTGCCYGRQLSCIILPGEEVVQVDAIRQYSEPGKVWASEP